MVRLAGGIVAAQGKRSFRMVRHNCLLFVVGCFGAVALGFALWAYDGILPGEPTRAIRALGAMGGCYLCHFGCKRSACCNWQAGGDEACVSCWGDGGACDRCKKGYRVRHLSFNDTYCLPLRWVCNETRKD